MSCYSCLGNVDSFHDPLRLLRRLDQGNRIPTYVGISLCWYSLPFAYSYDDLIEFLRFPHLSSVVGCSALVPVYYCSLILPIHQPRLVCFTCVSIVSRLP